jgi:hypothetical protein
MANRIAATIMHELRAMLPPAIFFLISFNILVLTIALLDDQSTVSAFSHVAACIGALLVAKAVLLSDMLPIVHRFRDGPLFHAIVWKAFLYFVATFLLHLAERLISAATNQYGIHFGVEAEMSQVDWGHFWVVQMWLALLFPIYVTSREIVRELGPDRIFDLFFGSSAGQ